MTDEPAGQEPPGEEAVGDEVTSAEGAAERVIVVAPVADAGRLAGVLALAGVRADVAPLDGRGCLVAARPPAGPAAAGGATGPDAVVRGTSRALAAAPVVVLRADVREGSGGEGGRGGSVRAEEWVRGQRRHGADVERSPGLVLAGLPEDAERVVHGTRRVDELDGATTSEGLGRLAAARLAAGRRPAGGRPDTGPGAPRPASPVLPAVLAGAGLLVLALEVLHLLAGEGSALVAAVALLGVVLGGAAALQRAAARGGDPRSGSGGAGGGAAGRAPSGEDGPPPGGS